tara:strand:- start:11068 stop:11685 length:618 start_codon:yes stop_codon:yes gene_type:complete
MKVIDINIWNRKQHYEHFSGLLDPYFALTIPFDVTKAHQFSKDTHISFFAKYLHDCMRAINSVKALRLRILDRNVVEFNVINASPTIMRNDLTYAFSFIDFDKDLGVFIENIESEKTRINNTTDLFPPKNGLDCVHCSALPWLNFTGHKEPVTKEVDSVPKIAFGKTNKINSTLHMNMAISVNHALVDGYDIGLFSEKFQDYLNE